MSQTYETSRRQTVWGFNIVMAVVVWTIWLIALGGLQAFNQILQNWEVALTMVFGSVIAGGTSEGGGAVAFPVFTKILHIPPEQARVFSLAIQSIGMSAASLTIIYLRLSVDWKLIRTVSIAGMIGVIVSALWIASNVPPKVVKLMFTTVFTSFGFILLWVNHSKKIKYYNSAPLFGLHEKILLFCVGIVGGAITAIIGTGIDILTFSIMVIIFQVSEKVSTPTSVIIMALNSICGFMVYCLLGSFTLDVQAYWLASVPIVVLGAPLGAVLFSYMSRKAIANILVLLIFIEFVSTVILIPVGTYMAVLCMFCFITTLFAYYALYKICRYNSSLNLKNVPERNFIE